MIAMDAGVVAAVVAAVVAVFTIIGTLGGLMLHFDAKYEQRFERLDAQIFALASGLKPLVEQAQRSDKS